jgi:hypothetical protein
MLVRKARRTAEAEAEAAEEADQEIGEDGNNEMETNVNKTDQATEAAPRQSTASVRQEKLSRLQKACLEFCIALLDYRITRREYNSLFVCTLRTDLPHCTCLPEWCWPPVSPPSSTS